MTPYDLAWPFMIVVGYVMAAVGDVGDSWKPSKWWDLPFSLGLCLLGGGFLGLLTRIGIVAATEGW